MKNRIFHCGPFLVAAFLLILLAPLGAHAGLSLQFFPTEEAKYLVRGSGWGPDSTVRVTVAYDTTYLAAPEATVSGGTLAELRRPGGEPAQLVFTIQNREASAGFELCLFFRKEGTYPAVIGYVTAEAIDPAGHREPVPVVQLPNPNLAPGPPATTREEP